MGNSHSGDISALKKYIRLADYLSVAQIFLRDNFLLEEPLTHEHIKKRLLGHWGTCPGINFVYANINRIINKNNDRDFLYIIGPGHGFPAYQANTFIDGSLSHYYPKKIPYTKKGIAEIVEQFSVPYGYPSHLNPEAPGVILEGGELGYSLSNAFGSVMDNPKLVSVCLVGDGEDETGPLAASWNANRFINPQTDGTVLPVVHINGYKISGPTVLGRMDDEHLRKLYEGLGYKVFFIDSNAGDIYEQGTEIFDAAIAHIKLVQDSARKGIAHERIQWPVILLKTPKGIGAPEEVDGEKVAGNHASHQIVFSDGVRSDESLAMLENWLKSYRIEELLEFTKTGDIVLNEELRSLVPEQLRALGASPYAHGEHRNELPLPKTFENFCEISTYGRGCESKDSMEVAGEYLEKLFRNTQEERNFRLFSPDETYSNHLHDVFGATARAWQWPIKKWDKDLARDGRVVEMLSEHTLFGMLTGYTLSGRHGIFATYEAFAQIVASMADQYIKFVKVARDIPFRKPISSVNVILSSLLERQDHNGFSHQSPAFIASMLERGLDIVNVYFPADKNLMLLALEQSLNSTNAFNTIVCGKQVKRTWLSQEEAKKLARDGIATWDFVSDKDPDVVVATCGDYVTEEAVIGVKLFKQLFPEVRVRFVNIFKLDVLWEAGHNTERDAQLHHALTADKPIVFNFHGYPATLKKMLFDHHLSERMIINGYEEEGSTTSPFDMKARNGLSRFHLVQDIATLAHAQGKINAKTLHETKNAMNDKLNWEREYIQKHKIDPAEIRHWEL